jgi:uncharacterized protein (DUF488 family)
VSTDGRLLKPIESAKSDQNVFPTVPSRKHNARIKYLGDRSLMKFYTIGYGGRVPAEFASILILHGIRAVADVLIHPDRASMNAHVKARSADKGIEKLLAEQGIARSSSWAACSAILTTGVRRIRPCLSASDTYWWAGLLSCRRPFCLMCAEKRVAECHRLVIAEFLATTKGWSVEHIE